MTKLLGLRCRECATEYELQATHVCEMCFGPLDVVYDQAALKKKVSRQRIESGRARCGQYGACFQSRNRRRAAGSGEGSRPLAKATHPAASQGRRTCTLR